MGDWTMRLFCLTIFGTIFIGLFINLSSAHAAPAQLYNKTISIGWSVQATVREPDGRERVASNSVSFTVYVSSAGRLFERASRSIGRRAASADSAPGASQLPSGDARGLHFEGNNLVANRGFTGGGQSGAMRAVVSFDANYSGCSTNVAYGKEKGTAIHRRGLDGVVREVLALNVTSTSCSIREGNAFAD